MERAMNLSAVPDDGEMHINGMWHAGRQLRAASGVPVVWVSDRALGSGLAWADLAEKSAESGLQPFLLYGVGFDVAGSLSERFGEQVCEPEDTAVIDGMDVAQVLEGWWWAPDEAELRRDEELRGRFGSDATVVRVWLMASVGPCSGACVAGG